MKDYSEIGLIAPIPEKSYLLMLLDKSDNEILRFDDNGDIFVHGLMIENDKQVVDGFREFLKSQGL